MTALLLSFFVVLFPHFAESLADSFYEFHLHGYLCILGGLLWLVPPYQFVVSFDNIADTPAENASSYDWK